MEFCRRTFKEYKDIAESYLKQNPYGLNTFPTNIEVLINKAGYAIEVETDLYKNYSVKGLVTKSTIKPNTYKILVDLYHYENQEFSCKFTLAEELSHIILHSDLYESVNTLDDFIDEYCSFTDDVYRNFEQQAKALASHILLPQQALDDFTFEWVRQNHLELKEEKFGSKEDLSFHISQKISRQLELSPHVINIAISKRYPDITIDKVIGKYADLLI